MTFSIFPRIIYKTKSKISGEIVVKEQLGEYTLHVDGLIQSGGIIKGLWKKALARIMNDELRIMNVLVLGLGGGTVVQLIKARWPEVKIVGIEIDPEIIKIGKKFFGLGEVKDLEIINADAIGWVDHYYESDRGSKFNLILVDLYLGGEFPQEAASDEFLKNIKKLLLKKGMVIFNRLISPGEDLAGFEEKLRRHFSFIEVVETPTNLFFLARS